MASQPRLEAVMAVTCHVSRYWAQLTCHWLSWRHGAVSLGQLPVHEHGGHGGVSLLELCQCWCGPGAGLRGTAGLLAAGPHWLPRRALPCVRPCSSRTSFPVSWPPWARGPGLLSLYYVDLSTGLREISQCLKAPCWCILLVSLY